MRSVIVTLLLFIFLISCSLVNENGNTKTVTELMEGKWKLVSVFGSPYDTARIPSYNTIIEFTFKDTLIEDHDERGTFTINGKIKFLEGGIYGNTEGPSPSYWDEWPLSWVSFEDTLIAIVDDMSGPRTLAINEVTEDSLTLDFLYWWFTTELTYARVIE